MCGILGFVGQCETELFNGALNKLSHRGPDGFGVWKDDTIIMGHRRLSILDLSSNGAQPMHWANRYIITFNGEIYDYVELRNDLEKKGVRFKTNTDTEVLLALFAEEGHACLTKLNGMWAFAIYDKQERTLFLSRDRMGKKPLFFSQQNNYFVFASEMKSLCPFLPKVEADYGLISYVMENIFDYEATESCLIKGIVRFPAASYAYFKHNHLEISKFWNPVESMIQVPKKYNEQVELFRELFIDPCKIRMRSDVPIGTALSGGIDSSATISTMSYIAKNLNGNFNRDWQHAYVASFPGSEIDETNEAKKVVNNLGISATFLNIDPIKDIDKIFYYSYLFEELYITSPIPFIQLYAQVKKNGTSVTLDGHGSDELFGGYPFDLRPKLLDDHPNPIKMYNTLKTINNVNNLNNNYSLKDFILEYKQISKAKFVHFYKPEYLQKNYARLDFFNNRLFNSTFTSILPTLLRNYDRYSMINGVEIRMPFLDHRIVSFAFSIPGSSKVRNGYTKALLRDAMKDFFPDEIRLLKRKIGFNSPSTEWIKGPLKEWLLDEMESAAFKNSAIIDTKKVKKIVYGVMNNHLAGFTDGEAAWTAFMPYVWEKSLNYFK